MNVAARVWHPLFAALSFFAPLAAPAAAPEPPAAPAHTALAETRSPAAPFAPLQTIEMPQVPPGPYADHMALDVKRLRLFTTPQASKSVIVLDLRTGTVAHTIAGFSNPHAILYREDRGRLFITDSGSGSLRIFDSNTYRSVKTIALKRGADGIAYNADSGRLYVANGGEEAGRRYSLISVVDTMREVKLADIRIESPALEAMVVDPSIHRLYVNVPENNSIAIIDTRTHRITGMWPVSMSRRNEAFALDAGRHRLYVGCNDEDVRGSIVVIDTNTGEQLQRLPIGSWVDSMFYDARRRRIYASSGVGEVYTYEQLADESYRVLQPVDTAVMARTSLYSTELDRLFVMVPHLGWTNAKVLTFQPSPP